MTVTRGRILVGLLAALLAASAVSLLVGVVASAHPVTRNGGTGDDVMYGHEHRDDLNGGPGCDSVHGEGGDDFLTGGNGGCDSTRGGPGSNDDAVVWDDTTGGDYADGGADGGDRCYVGPLDGYNYYSCEYAFGV